MAFEGDLSNLSLGDVLQTLAMTRQAGTFVIRGPNEERRLVFGPRGFGLLTVRQDVRDRVGQWLLGKGKVTAENFDQTQKAIRRKKDAVVEDALREKGLVAEADVLEARRYVSGEDIYDLFLWTSGTFEFIAGEAGDAAPYGNAWFDVTSIAMEAARRMDEVGHLRSVLPLSQVIVRADGANGPDPAKSDATKVFGLVDGARTIDGILTASHLGRFDTWKTLDSLREAGLVREATPSEMAASADELLRRKEPAAAAAILRRLLELNADDDAARRGLIEALTVAGDKRSAAAEWREGARRAEGQGDPTAAAEAYAQSVRLDKDNATAQDGLARCLLASGDRTAGAEAAKAATALHIDAKEFELAVQIAELAVRECQEDASLRITLANAHTAAGDTPNALLMLDDAASLLEMSGTDERRLLDVYRRIVQLDGTRRDCTRRIEEIESTGRFRRRKLAQRAAIAVGIGLVALIAVPMLRGPPFESRIESARALVIDHKLAEAEELLAALQNEATEEEMGLIAGVRELIANDDSKRKVDDAAKRLTDGVDAMCAEAAAAQARGWTESLVIYQKALDLFDTPDAKLVGSSDLTRLTRIRAAFMADLGPALQALQADSATKSTTVTAARDKFGPEVFKKKDPAVLQDLVDRTDEVAKIRASQDWPATAKGVEAIRKRVKSKDDSDRRILESIDTMLTGFPIVEAEGAKALAALRTKQLLERSAATHSAGQRFLGEGKLDEAKAVYRTFLDFCAELRTAEPQDLYDPIVENYLVGMNIEGPPQERLTQIDSILRAETEADRAIEQGDVPAAFSIRRDLVRVHRYVDFRPRFHLCIRIESRPAGATVYLIDGTPGGKLLGRTPLARFDYPIDTGATLALRLDGYEERTIERRGALEDAELRDPVELPKKPEFTVGGVGNIKVQAGLLDASLVLAGRDGLVRLHAARDGAEVAAPFDTESINGIAGAPAVYAGRIFVATLDGAGFLLDRALHKVRDLKFDGPVPTSLVATPYGVFCVTEPGTAQLLDAEGRAVWTQQVGRVLADPAVAGTRVLVTTVDGDLVALDAATGRVEARVRLPQDPRWTAAAASATHAWVAGDSGTVACVDLRAKRVAWSVPLGTALRSRPALADGRLLVATAAGSLHALDPSSGRELGREVLGGGVRFPPVTLDAGWAVVTEKGQALRFDATGVLVWRYDAKEDVVSPAALVGGRIVFVTKRGTLVSLRP